MSSDHGTTCSFAKEGSAARVWPASLSSDLSLKAVAESDPPVEYRFRIDGAWSREVAAELDAHRRGMQTWMVSTEVNHVPL